MHIYHYHYHIFLMIICYLSVFLLVQETALMKEDLTNSTLVGNVENVFHFRVPYLPI